MSLYFVPKSKEEYQLSDFQQESTIPHTLWVVHSPDQIYFFINLREAEKFYKKIKQKRVSGDENAKLASKPYKYILDNKKVYKHNKMMSG